MIGPLADWHVDVLLNAQENPQHSRTMLTKLTKQQHLLLQELERTKRRLREEVWAREEKTAADKTASPVDPADSLAVLWASRRARGCDSVAAASKKGMLSPSSRNHKQLSRTTDGRRDPVPKEGPSLKRSWREAGMGPAEDEAEGERTTGAMDPAGNSRASTVSPSTSPLTRIDLLPVMSTTGE